MPRDFSRGFFFYDYPLYEKKGSPYAEEPFTA